MDGEASYERDLDNFKATELRLGLPGTEPTPSRGSKRALDETSDACQPRQSSSETGSVDNGGVDAGPAAKVQVVGWPPIRSYRRNSFQLAKKTEAEAAGTYVKVSMDGAPYLRKIDLKVYEGYKNLREALEDMFKCFSLGDCGSEYAVTYEDKDGDWMLVGDVPWNMFVSLCKRLRIMKGSEARGLDSSS